MHHHVVTSSSSSSIIDNNNNANTKIISTTTTPTYLRHKSSNSDSIMKNIQYIIFEGHQLRLLYSQGVGNIMTGLLSAHMLGNEFNRVVCVSSEYKEFYQAFDLANPVTIQYCPTTTTTTSTFQEKYPKTKTNTIKFTNFDNAPINECLLKQKLSSNNDLPVIYLITNTYPRWPTQERDFNFFTYYKPKPALLSMLPWYNENSVNANIPFETVVHLRLGDSLYDIRKGLDESSLNALGKMLSSTSTDDNNNMVYVVTNHVPWYDKFEKEHGWMHPNWEHVIHSAKPAAMISSWGKRQRQQYHFSKRLLSLSAASSPSDNYSSSSSASSSSSDTTTIRTILWNLIIETWDDFQSKLAKGRRRYQRRQRQQQKRQQDTTAVGGVGRGQQQRSLLSSLFFFTTSSSSISSGPTIGSQQQQEEEDKEKKEAFLAEQEQQQNLQLFCDWYSILNAKQVYHTHSDFSSSAVHWMNIPKSYIIEGILTVSDNDDDNNNNNNTIEDASFSLLSSSFAHYPKLKLRQEYWRGGHEVVSHYFNNAAATNTITSLPKVIKIPRLADRIKDKDELQGC